MSVIYHNVVRNEVHRNQKCFPNMIINFGLGVTSIIKKFENECRNNK